MTFVFQKERAELFVSSNLFIAKLRRATFPGVGMDICAVAMFSTDSTDCISALRIWASIGTAVVKALLVAPELERHVAAPPELARFYDFVNDIHERLFLEVDVVWPELKDAAHDAQVANLLLSRPQLRQESIGFR